ncbi:ribonuclease HII [Pacificimonas pallii]|uniref:ribonuclease HII n=1 Tax=Pacificimonas pallii TaxID=2827236 RepID=UPI003F709D84
MPTYDEERGGPHPVCGVDEAGRGPLAGPVVAAAVILNPDAIPPGLADSKMLTAGKRESLFDKLMETAEVGIGEASVAEIDDINILWATMLAMERAVTALPRVPAMVLIDGNRTPRWNRPSRTLVKGDARCLSIAAASIIAKVTRDRQMQILAAAHPLYGWCSNQGYGTPQHKAALARHGATEHHRRSFAPVRMALDAAANSAAC